MVRPFESVAIFAALVLAAPGVHAQTPAQNSAADAGAARNSDRDRISNETLSNDREPHENDELNAIEHAVVALRRLIRDGDRPDIPTRELLGVDVLDGVAVTARISSLRDALSAAHAERATLLARASAPPGPEPSPDDLEPPSEPESETEDAPRDSTDEAASPTPEPAGGPELERLALQIERDELTLQLLSLPLHERALAVAHDDESQELAEVLRASHLAEQAASEEAADAEQAQRRALQEAQNTDESAAQELSTERARAQEVRGELAEHKRAEAQGRSVAARHGRERMELLRSVEAHLTDAELEGAVADSLHDRVTESLDRARGELDRAMASLDAPSELPGFELRIDVDADHYRSHPREREALFAAVSTLEEELELLSVEERRRRWTRAKDVAAQVFELDDARVALLPHLTPATREGLFGLGSEGRGQLEGEAYQLSLSTRWYLRTRSGDIAQVPGQLWAGLAVSSSRWALTELLLLLLAVGIFALRRRQLFDGLRELVADSLDSHDSTTLAAQWTGGLEALGVPLLMLAAVYGGFGLLRELGSEPEIELARDIVLSYAWYRLILAAAHLLLLSAASEGPNRRRRAELSRRILRSLRLIARYALWVVVLLVVSSRLLGRGYLHTLVVEFAWVGSVPIGWILLKRWRQDITRGYLARYPEGALARAIRRAEMRAWDVVVLLPAFLRLATHALVTYFGHTALRFDRTRRALAYLFRRRLERTAESVGYGTADIRSLPIKLQNAFDHGGPTDGTRVDHFPKLTEALSAIEQARAGRASAWPSIAVVGEAGIGKTSWLRELAGRIDTERQGAAGPHDTAAPHVTSGPQRVAERQGVAGPHDLAEPHYVRLDQTLTDEEAVCHWLSEVLGLGETSEEDADAVVHRSSVDELVDAVEQMEPRLLLLDQCQHLALRCVGGLHAFEAFARIVRRTAHRVGWICAFNRHVFEHMRYVLKDDDVFSRVVVLNGWAEAELGEVIDRRMRESGLTPSYVDLLPANTRPTERAEELERTRERYLRLLWDYSDGIPRIALHFWLRSLVPHSEETVRVRLFEAPSADDLERLEEQARFMLHAVVTNENLTVEEATEVLHYDSDECLSVLEMLRARDYVRRDRERYRVTDHWDRAVARYLKRKHLLFR